MEAVDCSLGLWALILGKWKHFGPFDGSCSFRTLPQRKLSRKIYDSTLKSLSKCPGSGSEQDYHTIKCLGSNWEKQVVFLKSCFSHHNKLFVKSQTVNTLVCESYSLCSVQFSLSVMSDSLQPHELQHARPPCPSPTPRVHSNSWPSSQWCYPVISSSVVPFSSCPQSLPASESFPMSQLFAWGGQSTGVSASASVLPKKSQGWSPSEWTGWISLQSKGFSRVFSNTTVQKHQFFGTQLSSQSNSHIHTWPLEKP